jgi:hypothetical protein
MNSLHFIIYTYFIPSRAHKHTHTHTNIYIYIYTHIYNSKTKIQILHASNYKNFEIPLSVGDMVLLSVWGAEKNNPTVPLRVVRGD